ncbi:pickpocket protein 19-like [Calliphora vicina]|uniref:pickpocket protein 19-like n=1 Tax=Calliphora vicina TaxID=7373 RepID=UPI00325C2177
MTFLIQLPTGSVGEEVEARRSLWDAGGAEYKLLKYNLWQEVAEDAMQGCIEFWQKGCIIGSQYLVKPNYHKCERRLWFGIFLVCSSIGFTLMLYYLDAYSQNVFRIVIEDHGRHEEFKYPTLGICEMGIENDQVTFARVEEVLTDTLYQEFPSLSSSDELKNFVYMLSFKNLHKVEIIDKFINYTKILPPNITEYLHRYDYKKLVNNITSSCEKFFKQCTWLNSVQFNCCEVFHVVRTMLGKCFLFNSNQTSSNNATKLVQQIEIFREPYRLNLTFKKAAKLFLLNSLDIPETIAPVRRYQLDERGVTLSLEFNVVPTINDHSLINFDPRILRCTQLHTNLMDTRRTYPFQSYTACITDKYYDEQFARCACTDFYAQKAKVMFCNLTQLLCLVNDNGSSNTALGGQCLPNCDDAEYHVENVYYSKIEDDSLQNVFTLDFVLLNFPTTHRRRQAIRQSEDKLAAFSGILGLFMGLSVVSILEFLYLTFCAFWNYKETSITQNAATIRARPKRAVRKRGSKNQIVFQP